MSERNLPAPDWSSTRSIYKKLSDEFHVLTGAYAIDLDTRRKLMLDHLILVIDELDFHLDKMPERDIRDELTQSILTYLKDENDKWTFQAAPKSLTIKIELLKQIVNELNVQDRFQEAAKKIFKFTEDKRHTKDEDKLINYVTMEGEATAELPLSIMEVSGDKPFGQFFNSLCMLMGIADLIIDARSDFRSGYIVAKPTFGLYFRLLILLMKGGLKLVWRFPKKFSLMVYCIKFAFLLTTTKD